MPETLAQLASQSQRDRESVSRVWFEIGPRVSLGPNHEAPEEGLRSWEVASFLHQQTLSVAAPENRLNTVETLPDLNASGIVRSCLVELPERSDRPAAQAMGSPGQCFVLRRKP